MPEGSKFEEIPQPKIAVIPMTPLLTPEIFEAMAPDMDAIIFIVTATGSVADRFTEIIRKKVSAGTPVFLVSDNRGNDHGILNPRKYEAQVGALEAGATPLQRVNVKDADETLATIREEFAKGKKGKELATSVAERLSFGDQEAPKPAWEKPEKMAELRTSTEQALRGAGISEEVIGETLKRWDEGGKDNV